MTRINVGIKPKELPDRQLLAEHREIKRIPNCIAKGKYSMTNQPQTFTLGTGHVKFFYNKLKYLYRRYLNLYLECVRRGFNVTYYGEAWDGLKYSKLYLDYKERPEDREIILGRFKEKGIKIIKRENYDSLD